jgi:cobaltochelatase CobT
MQKESILKENIDGEALQWAYERITKREEKKKIIFVISDGTPVDDATLSLNDKSYLKDHLRQVIYKIEKQKDIHLIAIGIMHDVGKYYQNAIRIDSIEELSKTLFLQIEKYMIVK